MVRRVGRVLGGAVLAAVLAVAAVGAPNSAQALRLTRPTAPADCAGVGPARTLTPVGTLLETIGVDRSGRLLYGGLVDGTIRAVDRAGAPPRVVTTVPSPGGIAPLANGEVLIASGNTVGSLQPGGATLLALDPASGRTRTLASGLVGANGLARASDGTVYTSDVLRNVIDRIGPDGRVTLSWWQGDGGPNGLAVSPDGRTLYVALTLAGRLVAVDRATRATRVVATAPPSRLGGILDGLTVDAQGLLYVAVGGTVGEVWRVDPRRPASLCALARGLSAPTSVALGQPGRGLRPGSAYVATAQGVVEIPAAVPSPSGAST